MIVVFWIFVVVLVIGIMYSPCPIKINIEEMNMSPSCIEGGNGFNKLGLYIATYIPIVMIIIYFLIFLELKVGIFNNIRCCHILMLPSSHSTQEMKLLIQVLLLEREKNVFRVF